MARYIILFFLMTPLAFAYTSKNIRLTQHEFLVRVKPQLNNINQDYQTLMILFNPHLKEYKPIFSHFESLQKSESKLKKFCSLAQDLKCIEVLEFYISSLSKILQSLENSAMPKEFSHYSLENILISFDNFQILRNQTFNLYLKMFNFRFFYQSKIHQYQEVGTLIAETNQLYNMFNIFLIKSSDERFRDHFLDYWNTFIKPVDRYILTHNEKSYFIRNLNSLNLSWNILNTELTKKNKDVSKQVMILLNTMHNRWKNILKITLR